jgi:preprotein translocase subunit SecB
MHSPLQLKDHRILRINFDTRQIDDQHGELVFAHAMEIFHLTNHDHTWLVRLDVQFKAESASSIVPYLGEIAVVGTFVIDPEYPESKLMDLVYMNGGSLLYGMAREILCNITSRGIHGPLLLPTLDARSFIPEKPTVTGPKNK